MYCMCTHIYSFLFPHSHPCQAISNNENYPLVSAGKAVCFSHLLKKRRMAFAKKEKHIPALIERPSINKYYRKLHQT